jgi:hypothetical protein
MPDYGTYGTNVHTTSELVRLVADLLDVTFIKRESDYRGAYALAESTQRPPRDPAERHPRR